MASDQKSLLTKNHDNHEALPEKYKHMMQNSAAMDQHHKHGIDDKHKTGMKIGSRKTSTDKRDRKISGSDKSDRTISSGDKKDRKTSTDKRERKESSSDKKDRKISSGDKDRKKSTGERKSRKDENENEKDGEVHRINILK